MSFHQALGDTIGGDFLRRTKTPRHKSHRGRGKLEYPDCVNRYGECSRARAVSFRFYILTSTQGNSLVRGPGDVVSIISQLTSPQTASDVEEEPIFPCSTPHTLAFQIGGKMFPIDPRDFTTQYEEGDATYCSADNLVGTDVPSPGALFTWNLGDPFFKSNVVIFYYGNLTHPSMDPPRIGFLSTVPKDASELHQIAVEAAQQNGGDFASMFSETSSCVHEIH